MTLSHRDGTAIAARIRALREMLDLTQVEFAKRCYVTQSAVSRWETGDKLPSRRNQHAIADVLRTSRSILFREVVEAEDRAVAA